MRAIEYSRFRPPEEVLTVVDKPAPVAGPGEALIRLEASPFHLADLKSINGVPWFRSRPLPATPGYEGVGRIEALGSAASGIEIGDRVSLPIGFGAWREQHSAGVETLWRANPDLAPEQVALIPINLRTAYLLLRAIRTIRSGDWLMQNAANSNVGHYLIKLAKRLGTKTVNVVRRPELIRPILAAGGEGLVPSGIPALA